MGIVPKQVTAETYRNLLIASGMVPGRYGWDANGNRWEYRSHPWVAGQDVFVLAESAGEVDCRLAQEVLPD